MKKVFSKIGLLMILVFSFLISFFQPISIKAVDDFLNVQTYVNVSDINRNDNLITVKLQEEYEIIDFTYEYTYYLNDILVSELIKNSTEFNLIAKDTFTFSVNESVKGVKLWKIKYLTENNIWADKQCKGDILQVGNMDSLYKKNYVEIEDGLELVKTRIGESTDGTYSFIYYKNVVHFNFKGLVVDEIEKITLDYSQYVHTEYLWNLFSKDTNYKNVVDYEVEKEDYIVSGGVTGRILDKLGLMTAKRYKIQKSDVEGYDWAVELPQTYKRMDTAASTRSETVLQNASVTKISYWSQGEYYEDILVLSPDTGWVKYEHKKETIWDKILTFFEKLYNLCGNNIFITAGVIILIICIIIALIKIGIKKIILGLYYLIEKLVIFIIKLLKWIICLPFKLIRKIFKKQE